MIAINFLGLHICNNIIHFSSVLETLPYGYILLIAFLIIGTILVPLFGYLLYQRTIKRRQEQSMMTIPYSPPENHDTNCDDIEDISDPEVIQRRMDRLKARFSYLHGRLDGEPENIRRDSDIKNQVKALPYNKQREINRTSFEIGDTIGSGNFGQVCRGELKLLTESNLKSTIAIKSINGYADESGIDSFLDEIKIMSNVNPHPNLVSMIAACTAELQENGSLWLLLEYCHCGDLRKYLHDNEKKILYGKESDSINSRCLITWAYDIANGMQYLAENRIMHGDLAARNVLLDEDPLGTGRPVAKVSDFGLSKNFYDNVKYTKESRVFVPWKWMALEYLTKDFFTLTSDVWSVGVLFWEIFSFGEVPYGQQGYDEVLRKLNRGYRLPCPKKIKHVKTWNPKELYEKISKRCFVEDPLERASFSDVIKIINKHLRPSEIGHYEQMANSYKLSRTDVYLKL